MIMRKKLTVLGVGIIMPILSSAQSDYDIMHDSVHQIMMESNAACYVRGELKYDTSHAERTFKYLDDITVEPQYYIWAEKCEQMYDNHYTSFNYPELNKFHYNLDITITWIEDENGWTVHSIAPYLGGE